MRRTKVCFIRREWLRDLEDAVNGWISEHEEIVDIVSIQYSPVQPTNNVSYSVMIVYRVEED